MCPSMGSDKDGEFFCDGSGLLQSMTRAKTKPDEVSPQTVALPKFVGSHGEVGTPSSIPNLAVKHLIADDTAYSCVGT